MTDSEAPMASSFRRAMAMPSYAMTEPNELFIPMSDSIQPATTFRFTPPKLLFTKVVEHSGSDYRIHVLRWGITKSETYLDPLPFHCPPGIGVYGNFLPWNTWLGEQLMYAGARAQHLYLLREEIAELITVANWGARYPDLLKLTAAKAVA